MKLLFGYGYLGSRVARAWRDAGEAVTVVTRSPAKAETLRRDGYSTIVADVADAATLGELPPASTVLYAVGYDRKSPSARSIEAVYAGGVKNVADAVQFGIRNEEFGAPTAPNSELPVLNSPLFVYISSTGVYGDAEGDWVDETTPPRPTREGGLACLAAERVLAEHPLGARSIVLRPAGIYGPDRIPRADALRRSEPIDAPPDGWLNLIHVDDLAQVVLDVERRALAGRVEPPRTYCVSDGRPVERRAYYGELARLLGAPPPRFVEPQAECRAVLRAAADKRISNARLLLEVAPTFTYPNFREGLTAIVSATSAKGR